MPIFAHFQTYLFENNSQITSERRSGSIRCAIYLPATRQVR